jgi:hypothetical protein
VPVWSAVTIRVLSRRRLSPFFATQRLHERLRLTSLDDFPTYMHHCCQREETIDRGHRWHSNTRHQPGRYG